MREACELAEAGFEYFTTIEGISGGYVELDEFDSVADAEKYIARMNKDEGFMKLYKEAVQLVVPATYSLNVWKAIE